MKKTYTYTIAALVAVATTLNAGTLVQVPSQPEPSLKGSFGLDIVSGYTYKGVKVDATPTVQPYFNLSVPVSLQGGLIDSSSLFLNTRQITTANAVKADWYRSEVTGGIALNAGSFVMTPAYHYVSSPNSAGSQFQALSFTVSYTDNGILGLPALNPYASVFYGFNGVAGNGSRNGLNYEVGIAPGFSLQTTQVSLPVNVGLGSNGFYATDKRYGYTSFGVATKTPLLSNVFLKSSATYFSTQEALNTNKNNYWQVGLGIGVEF